MVRAFCPTDAGVAPGTPRRAPRRFGVSVSTRATSTDAAAAASCGSAAVDGQTLICWLPGGVDHDPSPPDVSRARRKREPRYR